MSLGLFITVAGDLCVCVCTACSWIFIEKKS